MELLILNQRQLSRFSHHWFWGLQEDKQAKLTLYDVALSLDNDPEQQKKIALQLEQISQLFIIWRLMYWVFNINQYRFNYYALHSYISYKHYEEYLNMLSSEDRQNSEMIGAFLIFGLVLSCSSPVRQVVYRAIIPGLDWFQYRVRPYLPNNLSFVSIPEESLPLVADPQGTRYRSTDATSDLEQQATDMQLKEDGFIVKKQMCSLLKILGLEAKENDYMTLDTLKRAYRKKLLNCHPDKTLDARTAENFILVRTAFLSIWEDITSATKAKNTITNNGLFDEINSLSERLEQLYKEYQNEKKELNKLAHQYMDKVSHLTSEVKEFTVEVKELTVELKELTVEFKEYNQKARKYMQRVDQLEIDVNHLIAQRKLESSYERCQFRYKFYKLWQTNDDLGLEVCGHAKKSDLLLNKLEEDELEIGDLEKETAKEIIENNYKHPFFQPNQINDDLALVERYRLS